MDFIAIDFEIANNNFDSACSMGMVFVKNTEIIEEKYFTINPPTNYFDPSMTSVHGLSEDVLLNSPTFDNVWQNIKHYFNRDTLIVAHNAHFDMNVLRNCLITYDIPTPNFNFVCSIPISNRAIKAKNFPQSLEERTNYFGIEMEHHHNALSDARACAELVISSINKTSTYSIRELLNKFPDINVNLIHEHKLQSSFRQSRKFESIKMSEIEINEDVTNEDHPFYDKAVVFTGSLDLIDRKTAMQSVADLGGIPRSSVSRLTNFVVVGMQDISIVGPTGKSSKHRKAEELIENGHDIQIVDEQQFLNLISNNVMNT